MKIEIYSKTNCVYCDKAVHIAQQIIQETSEHSYDKYMLAEDFTREELLEKFPHARTFPQIVIDCENIGGYSNFLNYLSGE